MPHASEGISRADVLAYARARGVVVTSAQLDRWRKAGLLPSPERRPLQRPRRGTEAIYPPNTGAQLVVVANQLLSHRSLGEALWGLWWDGYAISILHLRHRLDQLLTQLERFSEYTASHLASKDTGHLQRAIEGWAARRPSDEADRLLRRRFKRSGFEVLTALAIELQLGLYHNVVDEDLEKSLIEELIEAGVETTPAFDTGLGEVIRNPVQVLAVVSHVLDPAQLRRAFMGVLDNDIEDARRELRRLLAGVGVLSGWLQMLGFSVNRNLLDLQLVRTDQKYHLLLIWLSLRQVEAVRQFYEGIMVLADALQAGRAVRIVGESIEVDDA